MPVNILSWVVFVKFTNRYFYSSRLLPLQHSAFGKISCWPQLVAARCWSRYLPCSLQVFYILPIGGLHHFFVARLRLVQLIQVILLLNLFVQLFERASENARSLVLLHTKKGHVLCLLPDGGQQFHTFRQVAAFIQSLHTPQLLFNRFFSEVIR